MMTDVTNLKVLSGVKRSVPSGISPPPGTIYLRPLCQKERCVVTGQNKTHLAPIPLLSVGIDTFVLLVPVSSHPGVERDILRYFLQPSSAGSIDIVINMSLSSGMSRSFLQLFTRSLFLQQWGP